MPSYPSYGYSWDSHQILSLGGHGAAAAGVLPLRSPNLAPIRGPY